MKVIGSNIHDYFVIFNNCFQDLKSIVLEVCKFLGKSLPDSVIDKIVEHSSFKSMKANPMSNPDTLKFNDPKVDGKLSFMRKGMSNPRGLINVSFSICQLC